MSRALSWGRRLRAGGLSGGKAAATVPIYQYSNANALAIVKQVRHEMDRLAKNFPPDVEYRVAFDTTRTSRRTSPRSSIRCARRSLWS